MLKLGFGPTLLHTPTAAAEQDYYNLDLPSLLP